MADGGTSVIPDLERIAKFPAIPRLTTARRSSDGMSVVVIADGSVEAILLPISFLQPPSNTTNNVAAAGNDNNFERMILI
jgi:hypothetical protein